MAQEGVTMDRLTEWIGEGEDRHAIPRMDLRKNGHQACCNKLAEYEDLEETGMISKWIPVKWHVILDAEREEEGIPDDIVYYLDCPMLFNTFSSSAPFNIRLLDSAFISRILPR